MRFEQLEVRLPLAANFVISELVADNDAQLLDNYGVDSDWLEIHNNGDMAGSLDGYYLTDDADEPTKWQFPDVAIPPDGYLLVFASGQDDRDPGAPLHANFALSQEGEYLGLIAPDGQTVVYEFSPEFPPQQSNISYGLGPVVDEVTLVAAGAAAKTLVPTDDSQDAQWFLPDYEPDANWIDGSTGVGFSETVPAFSARTFVANTSAGSPIGTSLDTIDEVLELIGDPTAYASAAASNVATVNFLNTGSGGRYGRDTAFPGLINLTDFDHFATEVKAQVTIPSAGDWTFGVSSDDGFLLQVGDFELTHNDIGPTEQFATFTFDEPGVYDLSLYHFEQTDDSWLELYAAPGEHAAWNAEDFRRVGDVPGGGLAVTSGAVDAGGGSIAELLGTNVEDQLLDMGTSFYTRTSFNSTNPDVYDQLTLRVKYDDAFVAYLNGVEIARRNFTGAPAWNSAADDSRTGDVLEYEEIDVSAFLSSLAPGANVLAVHGLNVDASDPDMLVLPELTAVDSQSLGLAYFATPTPGEPNGDGFVDFVGDPEFNIERGFYDSPFQLAITSATPNAEIYFTTDGEVPTQSTGTLYTGPLVVSGTTVLRTAAFRPGYLPSAVSTQTYLFLEDVVQQDQQATLEMGLPESWGNLTPDYGMDPDVIGTFGPDGQPLGDDEFDGVYAATILDDLKSIPSMSIVMDVDDMFGPNGIYTNSTQRGIEWERAASVEWIDDSGELEFQVGAGIRVQGGAFRSDGLTKKHSLRLLFKNEYGPGKLTHPIFGDVDGVAEEFNTIVLRGGANDGYAWDAARFTEQYLRDEFGRSLQLAMGHPAPHGTFVHLYINGVYWGLYNPVERPDNEFGASYFDADPDNWDAIHVDETPDGDNVAWNAMFDLARDARFSNDALMEIQGKNPDGTPNDAIAPLLDVESYIDYIALNVWGGNWDWPFKNFWAGRDRNPETTSGFQFFTWDFENTMGNNRNRSPLNATTLDQDFTGSRNAGQPHADLRFNAEYRMLFADQVHEMFFNDGLLTPDNLIERYAALADAVERAMVGESARWGDTHFFSSPLTLEEWREERDWILNTYLPQRSGIVLEELRDFNLYPELDAPSFNQHGGQVEPDFVLTITAPAGQIWYTLDGSDPRSIGGDVSTTALLYSGDPIDIPEGITVKARALSGNDWSALNNATFATAAPADASNLRIVEVHYNPDDQPGVADEQDLEFIELLNPSSEPVSLDNVQITEFVDATYAFPDGLVLGPGERIVVARTPAALQDAFAAEINLAPSGYADSNLSNGGERIVLLGAGGETIQDFMYLDMGDWPLEADGDGKSLELVDALADPTDPANWLASFYRGGSPGTDGSPPAMTADFDGDNDVDGADFLAWQRGIGTPQLQATPAHGDADGDRDVDAADLDLWEGNFGAASSASAIEVNSAIAAVAPSTQLFAETWWIFAAGSIEPAYWSSSAQLVRQHAEVKSSADTDAAFDSIDSPLPSRAEFMPPVRWFTTAESATNARAHAMAFEQLSGDDPLDQRWNILRQRPN